MGAGDPRLLGQSRWNLVSARQLVLYISELAKKKGEVWFRYLVACE